MTPSIHIEQLKTTKLPTDLETLAQSAEADGFTMVRRLIDNFRNGSNQFDKVGEGLFFVRDGDALIGVGGVNVDPYYDDAEIGRIRHLFILPERRGEGIGRKIMQHIEQHAAQHFSRLQLFTPTVAASNFYEAIGYKPTSSLERVSHIKHL